MSTKCTIDHGPDNYYKKKTPDGVDYHFYHECMDDDNVYLQLRNPVFFELDKDYVTLSIPGKLWNHLVRLGEQISWGGEDFDNPKSPEQRKKEFEEGVKTTLDIFAKRKKPREQE